MTTHTDQLSDRGILLNLLVIVFDRSADRDLDYDMLWIPFRHKCLVEPEPPKLVFASWLRRKGIVSRNGRV
jgi:hypothetical protein